MPSTTHQPTHQHADPGRTTRATGRVPGSQPRRAVHVAVVGKGGEGKTTTAAALGDALARHHDEHVTLVDLDAQGSLTSWLAPNLADEQLTVDDVLVGGAHVAEIRQRLRPGLDLLPVSNGLAGIEPTLPEHALAHRVLDDLAGTVVLDTPATRPLGPGALILRAALAAADLLVVPFRTSVLSLDVLDEVLDQVAAHEQLTGRRVPVLLLPAQVSRDGSADLVVRALQVGRHHALLPAATYSAWAGKAVASRQLLADRAPASCRLVTDYDDVAAHVHAMLAAAREDS